MPNFQPEHYSLCANTAMLDIMLKGNEVFEKDEKIVYNKMVCILKDELKEAECKEDIYSALLEEVECYINNHGLNADPEEVVEQILSDFDIKDSE